MKQLNGSIVSDKSLDYLDLVRKVAHQLVPENSPLAEFEDLVQEGFLGVQHAMRTFDCEKGYVLPHLKRRIKGAILDFLRKNTHLGKRGSRGALAKVKAVRNAWIVLGQALHRTPSDEEVRAFLRLASAEWAEYERVKSMLTPIPLDAPISDSEDAHTVVELIEDADCEHPIEYLTRIENIEFLAIAMRRLNKQEHDVLYLYVVEGRKMREIAEIYARTEGRICQIIGEAKKKVRKTIERLRHE